MASVTILCEQAIFTSARGPTGEGYRIMGASKGLRTEDKQKITRSSPSHESLCASGEADGEPVGAAFYPLPGDRICIALSRHAGAEHTGRGGQRVHTHNIVVNTADVEAMAFNPFNFIRALSKIPVEIPKASPGGVIPPLDLCVEQAQHKHIAADCTALLPPAIRLSAIQQFMEEKPLVVDLPKDWLLWAEMLLLTVPAPLRLKLSLAAGMRFTAGRGHILNVLRDEKSAVQTRAEAQGIIFLGPKSTASPVKSQWLNFVDRFWSAGDLAGLSMRTSRKYEDCSMYARERVGELFNAIDGIAQIESTALLDLVFRLFNAKQPGVEAEIRAEFRECARQTLHNRMKGGAWSQIKPIWYRLAEFWRNGGNAAAFAQPLINIALHAAMQSDPVTAADIALTVVQVPPAADREAHENMMQQVARQLSNMEPSKSPEDVEKLTRVLTRWRSIRPKCPIIKQAADQMAIH